MGLEEITTSYWYQFWKAPPEPVSTGYVYFNNVSETELQVYYGCEEQCPESSPDLGYVDYCR